MIHIGASGYSYKDWLGRFYPEGLPNNKFLDYYAQHFACVEVNYTYYRMPNARTLAAMSSKTGPGFRFVVKATGELTHERSGRDEAFDEFRQALQPLIDQGKLGGILAQFPYSFKPSHESAQYLAHFSRRIPDVPIVVEFRNAEWIGPETLDLLRSLDMGFCCVDEPRMGNLMPPVAEVTSAVGYVRFHGRNSAKWFKHDEAWERYDYLYIREELQEWVEKVAEIATAAQDTYVFFNNHYNAQAVQNASLFTEMLQEADLSVGQVA